MLKADLEKAYNREKREHQELKDNINDALKEILDNTCSEGRDHVRDFCDNIGIDMPTVKMVIEVPYGTEIENIRDDDYEDIDFEVIDSDYREQE